MAILYLRDAELDDEVILKINNEINYIGFKIIFIL